MTGCNVIGGPGDLDIERDLSIRAVWSGIWSVFRAIDRNVGNLGDRLTDAAEELIHVGLHPAAAEFDDRYHAAAGEAGRPIVGGAKSRDAPRILALDISRGGTGLTELEVGMDPQTSRHMEVRMNGEGGAGCDP